MRIIFLFISLAAPFSSSQQRVTLLWRNRVPFLPLPPRRPVDDDSAVAACWSISAAVAVVRPSVSLSHRSFVYSAGRSFHPFAPRKIRKPPQAAASLRWLWRVAADTWINGSGGDVDNNRAAAATTNTTVESRAMCIGNTTKHKRIALVSEPDRTISGGGRRQESSHINNNNGWPMILVMCLHGARPRRSVTLLQRRRDYANFPHPHGMQKF